MCLCTSAPTCVYRPFVISYRVLQPAIPPKHLIIAVHRLPFAVYLRLLSSSSRDNINPHYRTFSIAPASAANTSGFLQVSLSKVP
jgi:hypothetical protein